MSFVKMYSDQPTSSLTILYMTVTVGEFGKAGINFSINSARLAE